MIAFPSPEPIAETTDTVYGVTHARGEVVYVPRVVERAPDRSRMNRHDRRTLEALARKYGWQL